MYFITGYTYVNYGLFVDQQHHLFELAYPAHPLILQRRGETINSICYFYPPILRNEIEYLHQKVSEWEKSQ